MLFYHRHGKNAIANFFWEAIMQDNTLWDALADDCDARMGSEGNDFHRVLVRPATLRLLGPKPGERVLDACCGNGLFSLCLAQLGCEVVAFDFSTKMLGHAKRRCAAYPGQISFTQADATHYGELTALIGGPLDKAVANIAVMDIEDAAPLFRAVYDMLAPGGVFVFSAVHPCFQTPGDEYTPDGEALITYNYIEPCRHSVTILANNEKRAWHWHRPLQVLLGIGFAAGFVLDGLEEPVFAAGSHPRRAARERLPMAIVMRMRKIAYN